LSARTGAWLLAGLLAVFLAAPVAVLVARALVDGSALSALGMDKVLDALRLSLATTAGSLVLTVVLGTPLAALLAHRTTRATAVLDTIIDLPIVLPPSVAGLALLLVLGRRGLFGDTLDSVGLTVPFTTLAVVLAQTFVSAPFFVRAARAGLAGVDRDLEDAARVDGAADWQVFRWITLPLASTPLAAGLVMSWARALGEFGATIMFAGSIAGVTRTLPLLVYAEFQGANLNAAIAAAAVLAVAAFAVLLAVRLLHWPRAFDLRTA
jgi:molybdate transport system permease protein